MSIRSISSLIVYVGLLSISCDSIGGTPSESNARAIFENRHKENIKAGFIKIESFQKINGEKTEAEGYLLEYVATVVYPKGVMPECVEVVKQGAYDMECFSAQARGHKFKSVGQREKVTGKIRFKNTERGWRGEDGNVY